MCKHQVLNLKCSSNISTHKLIHVTMSCLCSLWAFCAFWRPKGSSSNVAMAAISTIQKGNGRD